eukprot:TRINITY_DN2132_c0_g1_i4.p1 TRINITY_DN2132_c0_g1~~TRINITY_DN2132_c0_g1_i4.p1  ORF type:complete len:149 (-),score=0.05 TRINITY_DN2132_c0_g1_i4:193-639(-)
MTTRDDLIAYLCHPQRIDAQFMMNINRKAAAPSGCLCCGGAGHVNRMASNQIFDRFVSMSSSAVRVVVTLVYNRPLVHVFFPVGCDEVARTVNRQCSAAVLHLDCKPFCARRSSLRLQAFLPADAARLGVQDDAVSIYHCCTATYFRS